MTRTHSRIGLYYEDMEVGDRIKTPSRTITETDIVNFLGLSGIYEELHMSVEYIKTKSVFGRRVSPGPLTFIIAEGLAVMSGTLHHTGMAFLGTKNLTWPRPVYCNDTITVEIEVLEKRLSKKPDRGVVTFRHDVFKQTGELVLQMDKVRLIRRRPSETPAES